MTIPIGITTVRRSHDYLSPLLASIPEHMREQVFIAPTMKGDIPDGIDSRYRIMEPLLDTVVESHEERTAGRCLERNTDRLMSRLMQESRREGAEIPGVFLTLQDDIEACEQAWERVVECAKWAGGQKGLAWISFYTPYRQVSLTRGPFWIYPAGSFYGELAMLWSHQAASQFLDAKMPITENHDLQINAFFKKTKWRTLAHCPCLFQHIGVESATGKAWVGHQRTSMNYKPDHKAVDRGQRLRRR